jgi:predicted AAA+ superfamily ATPase
MDLGEEHKVAGTRGSVNRGGLRAEKRNRRRSDGARQMQRAAVIGDEGARYENFVAVSLMKYNYFLQDIKGKETTLQYVKTKEEKEIDFCLTENNQIRWGLEAKLSDDNPVSTLRYFKEKYQWHAIQLVKNCRIPQVKKGIHIHDSFNFLKNLRVDLP